MVLAAPLALCLGKLNSRMSTSEPWPTNIYGTTWRRGFLYFDWRDEEIVLEAITTISPFKVTVRCHPIAAIDFDTEAEMVLHFMADTLPSHSKWNNEGMSVIIDPCRDPEAMQAIVDERMENVCFSVFGLAILDLKDEATYEALEDALAERRGCFVGEYPVIEF